VDNIDYIDGAKGTPASSGTADSISAYFSTSWNAGEEVKFALYDSSRNLIASTPESTSVAQIGVQFL